ncbi:mitochondrial thiamine pyrophosphate carrier-like [Brevipalpus obovatus]|uniref:mitochondrial thiamine pyrophosphate carrier-like n=1 Tax=Brevipalpus obovatus TaxID=246614 RepID=UPI003D9EE8F1
MSKESKNSESAVAGATSGFITRFFIQPLDVLKIRFQLQVEPISHSSLSSKYRSNLHCLSCIVKEEGFISLWKGHVPGQYLSIVYGAVQFWAFEVTTKSINQIRPPQGESEKFLVNFNCGALAGGLATFASMPLDVIRTRLVGQSEPRTIHNFRHGFRYIFEKEKVYGFYRGSLPAVLQTLPTAGLHFAFNKLFNSIWTNVRNSLARHSGKSEPSATSSNIQSFLCGGMAGVSSKIIVYPLDLAKKRLQIQGFNHARVGFGLTPKYSGLFNCCIQTIRDESFLGLFKGLSPSLVKAFISTALYFYFYEKSLHLLLLYRKQST